MTLPLCPAGSRPLINANSTLPQKCLPRNTGICHSVAQAQNGPQDLCCWHNQIDYYCCVGVQPDRCPTFQDVTVIIQKGQYRQYLRGRPGDAQGGGARNYIFTGQAGTACTCQINQSESRLECCGFSIRDLPDLLSLSSIPVAPRTSSIALVFRVRSRY